MLLQCKNDSTWYFCNKKNMDSLIPSQLTKWLNHKRRLATHLRRWAGRCSSAGGGPGTRAGPPRWRSSPPSADAPAPGSGSAQGPLTARQISTETEFTQENHLDYNRFLSKSLFTQKGPTTQEMPPRYVLRFHNHGHVASMVFTLFRIGIGEKCRSHNSFQIGDLKRDSKHGPERESSRVSDRESQTESETCKGSTWILPSLHESSGWAYLFVSLYLGDQEEFIKQEQIYVHCLGVLW